MVINLPLTIGASVAVPILTHFVSAEKIKKMATTRSIVLGTMATFFILTTIQIIQDQQQSISRTVSVSRGSVGNSTSRPIKLASPVGVGGWASEPQMEYYSGTPPYQDGHIYVD